MLFYVDTFAVATILGMAIHALKLKRFVDLVTVAGGDHGPGDVCRTDGSPLPEGLAVWRLAGAVNEPRGSMAHFMQQGGFQAKHIVDHFFRQNDLSLAGTGGRLKAHFRQSGGRREPLAPYDGQVCRQFPSKREFVVFAIQLVGYTIPLFEEFL